MIIDNPRLSHYIFVDALNYIPCNCPNSTQSLELVLLKLEKVKS